MLLEDLGDSVTVSIRDDGVGIPDGRLEEAVGEGTDRDCEINCGADELARWQREADHRAGMRDGMGTDDTPTVMVVDDHPIWRDAVARDLADDGFRRGGHGRQCGIGPQEGRGGAAERRGDGHATARRRRRAGHGRGATVSPSSKILVLSASDERDDVLEAVKAGATGYLVKSASKAELGDAVRATADGRAVFTPGLAGLVLGEYRRIAQRPDSVRPRAVTERETEILRHVAKGLTAKQIAARLSLSHRTVENHVQATFRKLQVANRVELARYAIEHGLDE